MLSYPMLLVSRLVAQRARARQIAHLDELPDHLRRDIGLPVRDASPHAARRRSLHAFGW